ncbi:MAG: hypothetical protein Q4G07_06985 [Oscillospiraceae bacterium]|nr:hypothetical protein [Oscillospiraceae bacterium]
MKKIQAAGAVLLIVTLIIAFVHIFVTPLSDMLVRINGIVMLADLAFLVFSTAKMVLAKKTGKE